ncbi:MAG: Lrp/AsnC ligand binding domain-containing protein [Candidatus Thermoplasmatota archaeon]|nr:Lrp/AsnC ligand binding domain-containing protein [Candidatus Thermoplasmatota archaeon]
MSKKGNEELDGVLSSYYDDEEQVTAIITLKVDTKEADKIAAMITSFDQARDVFLVTGDTDIICKVKFESYGVMKAFVMEKLAQINGIKDIKTMMVVTAYKEKGKKLEGGG